jgi:hypothetical protein
VPLAGLPTESASATGASPSPLGEDGELIGGDVFVFVRAGLQVPALEFAAIGTREGARAKAADGRALPVAVIDVDAVELGALRAGICGRNANGNAPRGGGNGVWFWAGAMGVKVLEAASRDAQINRLIRTK